MNREEDTSTAAGLKYFFNFLGWAIFSLIINSIGWALFELNNERLRIRMAVSFVITVVIKYISAYHLQTQSLKVDYNLLRTYRKG